MQLFHAYFYADISNEHKVELVKQIITPRNFSLCRIIVSPHKDNNRNITKKDYTITSVFSVTYYLELHNTISFCCWCHFLPSKVVNVLQRPNNQFDIC